MCFYHKRIYLLAQIFGLCWSALLFTSCGSGDTTSTSTPPAAAPPAATGTTVQVSVVATDPDNVTTPGRDQLHYRWAATEGTINNVDAPKTTWVVPPGAGLQFAYVLVTDDKGGFSESRAAVMTQSQAVASTTTPISAPTPTTTPNYIWGTIFFKGALNRNVYLPEVTVRITRQNEPDRTIPTDKKGEFFFSGLSVGGNPYSLFYTIPGRPEQPFTQPITVNPSSPRSYIEQEATLIGTLQVAGSVRLADKSHCGIRDEFFTDLDPQKPNALKKPISATAQLLTSNNGPLSGEFPVNNYGDYLIVRSALGGPTSAKVRIHCEQGNDKDSTLFNVQSGLSKAPAVVLDNSRPEIKSMTVLLNGEDVGRPDLPKPRTLFPKFVNDPITFTNTDLIAEIANTPGDDAFLGYKGIDTRMSACRYYQALGAVEECTASGYPNPQKAQLTLDEWKRRFNLSPFQNGNPQNPRDPSTQEVQIIYINRADLNFARDMQAVRLSDGSIAYNVCNYAGPQNTTGQGEPVDIGTEQQPNIDLAIDNARRGIGMVACVAMDYSITPGINNNQPFTKFYTFGPSGKLLLSVSLDGRREKFMPGSCTACHGGDFHGGHYPDDMTGRPDIGSRWQPFDMANLDFSSTQKQDMAAVEAAIKQLNQMMVPAVNGGLPPVVGATIDITPVTTVRTKELINGWYGGGTLTNQSTAFVPSLYCPPNGGIHPCGQSELYQKVAQGMCQTCHAAQKLNESFLNNMVCGSNTTAKLADNHTMTNALVPFERFWRDPTLPPLAGCSTVPATHPPL